MLACLIMALAGFLTFGDKTKGNVLNNFPSDNVMVNIARLCVSPPPSPAFPLPPPLVPVPLQHLSPSIPRCCNASANAPAPPTAASASTC